MDFKVPIWTLKGLKSPSMDLKSPHLLLAILSPVPSGYGLADIKYTYTLT